MKLDRLGVIAVGLGLIGFGLVILLANWIGWDRVWPIFPIIGGLAAFLGYAIGGFRDGGLAFLGTAAILVGLFFFGFVLGYWEWSEMAHLWPAFLLIGGVAFLALFVAERRGPRDIGVLGFGCAAIVAGLAGLAYTHGLIGSDVIKYWPLLIVLVGVVSLIGALVHWSRRE